MNRTAIVTHTVTGLALGAAAFFAALVPTGDRLSLSEDHAGYFDEVVATVDAQWSEIQTRETCTDAAHPRLVDRVAVVTMPRTDAEVAAHVAPRFDLAVVRLVTFDEAYRDAALRHVRVLGYCD